MLYLLFGHLYACQSLSCIRHRSRALCYRLGLECSGQPRGLRNILWGRLCLILNRLGGLIFYCNFIIIHRYRLISYLVLLSSVRIYELVFGSRHLCARIANVITLMPILLWFILTLLVGLCIIEASLLGNC